MANLIQDAKGELMSRRQLLSITAVAAATCSLPAVARSDSPALGKLYLLHKEAYETSELQATAENDRLINLIANYEDLRNKRSEISSVLQILEDRDDNPQFTGVGVEEIAGRQMDYPPNFRQLWFLCEADLDAFFDGIIHGAPPFEALDDRVRADWLRAKCELQRRRDAVEAWEEASGCKAAEEEWERLFEDACKIEDQICRYPCRSLADILAKVAFCRSWLAEDGMEWAWQHAALLESMFTMLPNTEQKAAL